VKHSQELMLEISQSEILIQLEDFYLLVLLDAMKPIHALISNLKMLILEVGGNKWNGDSLLNSLMETPKIPSQIHNLDLEKQKKFFSFLQLKTFSFS
jgi:hypothetical protein